MTEVEFQRWLPSVLALVAAVVFVVRNEQGTKALKDKMDKVEGFLTEHAKDHVMIGQTLVRQDVEIGVLKQETAKDHERVRDLQINLGRPRHPHSPFSGG